MNSENTLVIVSTLTQMELYNMFRLSLDVINFTYTIYPTLDGANKNCNVMLISTDITGIELYFCMIRPVTRMWLEPGVGSFWLAQYIIT